MIRGLFRRPHYALSIAISAYVHLAIFIGVANAAEKVFGPTHHMAPVYIAKTGDEFEPVGLTQSRRTFGGIIVNAGAMCLRINNGEWVPCPPPLVQPRFHQNFIGGCCAEISDLEVKPVVRGADAGVLNGKIGSDLRLSDVSGVSGYVLSGLESLPTSLEGPPEQKDSSKGEQGHTPLSDSVLRVDEGSNKPIPRPHHFLIVLVVWGALGYGLALLIRLISGPEE